MSYADRLRAAYLYDEDKKKDIVSKFNKTNVDVTPTTQNNTEQQQEQEGGNNPLIDNFNRQKENNSILTPNAQGSPMQIGASFENMPEQIRQRQIDELKDKREEAKQNANLQFGDWIQGMQDINEENNPKYTEDEIDRYQKANSAIGGAFSALAGLANSIAVSKGAYSAQVPDAYKQVYDHWENVRKDNRQRQQAYDKIRMQIAGAQYQKAQQDLAEIQAEYDKAVARQDAMAMKQLEANLKEKEKQSEWLYKFLYNDHETENRKEVEKVKGGYRVQAETIKANSKGSNSDSSKKVTYYSITPNWYFESNDAKGYDDSTYNTIAKIIYQREVDAATEEVKKANAGKSEAFINTAIKNRIAEIDEEFNKGSKRYVKRNFDKYKDDKKFMEDINDNDIKIVDRNTAESSGVVSSESNNSSEETETTRGNVR